MPHQGHGVRVALMLKIDRLQELPYNNHMALQIPVDIIEHIMYSPETGELWWITRGHGRVLGAPIRGATLNSDEHRYYRVGYGGHSYKVHRVAWFLATGEQPDIIDHINGIGTDNRLCNLRSTTPSGNAVNQVIHRKGRIPGVWPRAGRKGSIKWEARLPRTCGSKGRVGFIGNFDTQEEARAAVEVAVNKRRKSG